jgi:hypothetical protein
MKSTDLEKALMFDRQYREVCEVINEFEMSNGGFWTISLQHGYNEKFQFCVDEDELLPLLRSEKNRLQNELKALGVDL